MALPNIIGTTAAGVLGTAASSFLGNAAAENENGLYKINEFNWYQSLPYGFSFFDVNSSSNTGNATPTSTVYLPIAPNNLSIVTHFATNLVTTLYGIVEEHSEVRYYDITISGTTGIAPKYTQPFSGISSFDAISPGRQDFESPVTPPILGTLSALSTISNPLTGIVNMAPDLLAAQDRGNNNHTGLGTRQTGYWAFHQLYQFFLKYKLDASGITLTNDPGSSLLNKAIGSVAKNAAKSAANFINRALGRDSSDTSVERVHPIQFLNYKDGNKYDCVPIAFTLVRSADNPMLYNYSIKLKAFNLRSVTSAPAASSQLAKLGISGSVEKDSLFQSFGSAMGAYSAIASRVGR